MPELRRRLHRLMLEMLIDKTITETCLEPTLIPHLKKELRKLEIHGRHLTKLASLESLRDKVLDHNQFILKINLAQPETLVLVMLAFRTLMMS